MKAIYEFGDFRADPAEQRLEQGGRPVALPPKVFETLLILLQSEGRLIDKDEFMGQLWPGVFVEDGTLTQNISNLRKALGNGKNGTQMIETVPKRGYRFAAPVRKVVENASALPDVTPPIARPMSGRNWRKISAIAALLAAVFLMAAGVRHYFLERRAGGIRTIAVLPFANDTGDRSLDYLSRDVRDKLAQIPDLHVISQSSTSGFGGAHTDPISAGEKLNAQAVLTGQIMRGGDSVTVKAEMVNVGDRSQIWAHQYSYRLGDLSLIQAELAASIAAKLVLPLTPAERAHLAKRPTEDAEAYRLYLQGRYFANQNIAGSLRRSIDAFQQATERDPKFALAYVGLAYDYDMSDLVGISPAKESYPKARAAATRAIMLDPSLGEAHNALAMEKSRYEFDWNGAREEFEKALELEPNSVDALRFYAANYLTSTKRHREAITLMKRAVELEPLSLPANFSLAIVYHMGNQLEPAELQYRRVIELAPNFPSAHLFLSNVFNSQGRYEESIAELEKGMIMVGESPHEAARQTGALSQAFKSGGEKAYWRKYADLGLQAIDQPTRLWFGDLTFIAQGFAQAGELDKAMEWLNKAFEQREGCLLPVLNVHQGFRNLHGDPRFTALLLRMGLPE
jgi:DNA-binding winged helix-turn-helix (wHTH) protein/TolB-like protein